MLNIFFQYIEFRGSSDSFFSSGELKPKTVTNIVATKRRGTVAAGQSESWENFPLHVPSLPASELQHCEIIDIKYVIKVRAGFRAQPALRNRSLWQYWPRVLFCGRFMCGQVPPGCAGQGYWLTFGVSLCECKKPGPCQVADGEIQVSTICRQSLGVLCGF